MVGASDHTVTHSLYITDPDGNEIELYVDVPGADGAADPSRVAAPIKPLKLRRPRAGAAGRRGAAGDTPRWGRAGRRADGANGDWMSCRLLRGNGTWRSLAAHLTGGQGVAGSNPAVPTSWQGPLIGALRPGQRAFCH